MTLQLTNLRSMALAITVLTALAFTIEAQNAKLPITQRGLVEALRAKGLSEQELIQRVDERGVDFQVTAETETELKEAGAGSRLLETVRMNYRAGSQVRPPATPTVASSSPGVTPARTGAPLSKAEIVTLLQTGMPSDQVEKLVEVRGVSFAPSAAISAEITALGGTRSLLGAIAEKASAAPHAPVPEVAGTPDTSRSRSTALEPPAPAVSAARPKAGSRVYIAPMDGNLHGFLATEIVKKKIPVTLVTDEKQADFIMTGASLAGDNKWYNTVFGGRDKNEGNVQLVSVAAKQVVWAGEAGDRSIWWGNLRRGGQRKVADRLANRMKKELFE